MLNRRLLAEEESIHLAECLGCHNEFLVEVMYPVLEEYWVCKPCYRNELEGLS